MTAPGRMQPLQTAQTASWARYLLVAWRSRELGSGGSSRVETNAICSARVKCIVSCSLMILSAASCAQATRNSLKLRFDNWAARWSKAFCALLTLAPMRYPRTLLAVGFEASIVVISEVAKGEISTRHKLLRTPDRKTSASANHHVLFNDPKAPTSPNSGAA